MKNVFIDSNIWLSLYHFTDTDLEQFKKLVEYIDNKSISIICTSQVYDEIQRNRENKLKDSLKQFSFNEPNYPVFVKGYEKYQALKEDFKSISTRFKELNNEINKDLAEKNLPADRAIKELFDKITIHPSDEFIEAGYQRYRKGNPPGKNNSYGDAINWEALLSIVPDKEDVYFISGDKDFGSVLDPNRIHPFLEDEWKLKKESNIYFYNKLTNFLNDHIQDIVLQVEQEKKQLIESLRTSLSFFNTHLIIRALNMYENWSSEDIEDLCNIVYENDQVGMIFYDEDVFGFYKKITSDISSNDEFSGIKKVSDLITSKVSQEESEDV